MNRFLLLFLLLGCSSGTTTPGSDASTDGPSPGSDAASDGQASCNACGPTAVQALSHPLLCGPSAKLFENLQNCACSGGPCGTQCDKAVCSTAVPASDCMTCLAAQCAATWDPCKADTAH